MRLLERIEDDLTRVRQALGGSLAKANAGPTSTVGSLVMLSGLPGTGKSYFARQLQQQYPVTILSSDQIRKTLIEKPRYTRGEHRRVFAVVHHLLEEQLQRGVPVVLDAVNINERARQPVREVAARLGAPMLVVQLVAPPKVVRRRLERRIHRPAHADLSDADWTVYCRMRSGVESLVEPYLLVDSSRDIGPAIAETLRFLRS